MQLLDFPKGLKYEFETDMVNEPSVFEPWKLYCITNFGIVPVIALNLYEGYIKLP